MKTIEFILTKYDSDLTDAEWSIIEKYFSQIAIELEEAFVMISRLHTLLRRLVVFNFL